MCLAWDATCVNTYADSHVLAAATSAGTAAREAEVKKRKKYDDLTQRFHFEPLAFETSGACGPSTKVFVRELGARIASVTEDRRETAWLWQRLALAVVRGNAASILQTAEHEVQQKRREQETGTWRGRTVQNRRNGLREEPLGVGELHCALPSRNPLDDPELAQYLKPRAAPRSVDERVATTQELTDQLLSIAPSCSEVSPGSPRPNRLATYASLLAEMKRDAVSGYVEPGPGASSRRSQLLAGLLVGSVLCRCCSLVHNPLLPEEAARRGLDRHQVSTAFSYAAFVEVISFPAMGWLTSRLDAGRLYLSGVVVCGLATAALSFITYVEGSRFFLPWCMAARTLEAVGRIAAVTAGKSISVSQFRNRRDAAVKIASGVNIIVSSPALGGSMYAVFHYGALPYTLGGLLLGGGFATLAALPALNTQSTDRTGVRPTLERLGRGETLRGFVGALRQIAACPDNWLAFVVMLTIAMNWWTLGPSLMAPVRAAARLDTAELGLLHAASLASSVLALPVWVRLSGAVSNSFLLVSACLCALAGAALLLPLPGAPASRGSLVAALVAQEVFGCGACVPLLPLLLRTSAAAGLSAGPHAQTLVFSLLLAVHALGKLVFPLAGAAVAERLGLLAVVLCLSAGTLLICLLLLTRGLAHHYMQRKQTKQNNAYVAISPSLAPGPAVFVEIPIQLPFPL
ncbi:MFS-type transporter SLC18B1 [Amphibalanus amphitrite]|uniref:MFS-type transporter SLC18B1 n=1 Tax=Amphibalanus amphitrite TaxID=1232801 RepID=A0A6A4VXE3_AMPAM|nr:MFS-type transporter SLC18B1 [Amphibalanus amphitrite]